MGNLKIWYNKNRAIIWIVVFIIVVIIALIQTLDKYYKNNPNKKDNISTSYNTDTYSIITKKEINEKIAEESGDLINSFMQYCNNQRPEQAYELLSTDCKRELYPTVECFKLKYYNKIFTEKKSYNSILWIVDSKAHTYRVEIMPDILATGKKDNMPIEDYYTIVIENEQYKLNINRYIGRQDINILKKQDDINITILSKIQYMDYETYKISIQNNTGSNLIFNTKEKTNSIYIQDENNLNYLAFLNEITSSQLQVPNGTTNVLEIKFNRGYKPAINIERIIFEDIYTNGKVKIIQIDI